MLDWKHLEDPLFLNDQMKKRRGQTFDRYIDGAAEAHALWKDAVRKINTLRERKNSITAEFVEAKKAGEPEVAEALLEESKRVGEELKAAETQATEMEKETRYFWAQIPNIPDAVVPMGAENVECPIENFSIDTVAPAKPTFEFKPKDHVDIGTTMECMDFEQTAKISGTRFVTLRGALAKLERVLGNWMLDSMLQLGFEEVAPPSLVHEEAMFGTGQLPKFEEDLFKTDNHYLIPTAEVSLTNMFRDTITEVEPILLGTATGAAPTLSDQVPSWAASMVALTNCYRAEAGSAGRDTRGMLRQHEFKKVELVTVCLPGVSEYHHQGMVSASLSILVELGLNFRVMLLSGEDMGFSAQKTYDLEVWIPSQNCYREIASISNCGDFQARRMNARYKIKGQKGTEFFHTLNGSALAVGRTLLAVMENYQTEQGGIEIPQVLRDRMGGRLITHEGEII